MQQPSYWHFSSIRNVFQSCVNTNDLKLPSRSLLLFETFPTLTACNMFSCKSESAPVVISTVVFLKLKQGYRHSHIRCVSGNISETVQHEEVVAACHQQEVICGILNSCSSYY